MDTISTPYDWQISVTKAALKGHEFQDELLQRLSDLRKGYLRAKQEDTSYIIQENTELIQPTPNLEFEKQCAYCKGSGKICSSTGQIKINSMLEEIPCIACDGDGIVFTSEGQKVADLFYRLIKRQRKQQDQ